MSTVPPEWIQGRPRCCESDFGGSHYHCGACGEVSSSMGHYLAAAPLEGKWVRFEGHMCCPSQCHLGEDHPDRRDKKG